VGIMASFIYILPAIKFLDPCTESPTERITGYFELMSFKSEFIVGGYPGFNLGEMNLANA
jgi:hypothetical protein